MLYCSRNSNNKQFNRKETHILCIIFRKPVGLTIKKSLVETLWDRNKDGAGYLVNLPEKGWTIKKGIMNKEEFLKTVEPYFGEDFDLVCHMRIKTVGQIVAEHTHPFNWTANKSNKIRYMFHNGTVKILKPKQDSDSMFLAEMLSNVSTDEGHAILKDLSANGAGRFVTLANDQINIFPDSESITQDGVWFSNDRHVTKVTTVTTHNQYMGYHAPHTNYNPTPPVIKKAEDPVTLALKDKHIKVIAGFYAQRAQAVCNDAYITKWKQENGADFPVSVLEQIATICIDKINSDEITDPMFEFLVAFQQS